MTHEPGTSTTEKTEDLDGGTISDRWLEAAPRLRRDFEKAQPFPLVVLDDFLVPELARQLLNEFPPLEEMPVSRDYVFGSKHELSSVESSGIAGSRFHQTMLSARFARFLRELTGFDVFVDPQFHGGGFHQGGDGSFLDMHVDFNIHPLHHDWRRTLNILVYLCPHWQDSHGGHLLIKGKPEDEPRAIPVGFNRAVIMLTADHTYHGYRPMTLPPGVTRKSVATYAYMKIAPSEGISPHTTRWVPEEAGRLKRTFARHYESVVRLKEHVSPSRTARNR